MSSCYNQLDRFLEYITLTFDSKVNSLSLLYLQTISNHYVSMSALYQEMNIRVCVASRNIDFFVYLNSSLPGMIVLVMNVLSQKVREVK